MKLCITEKPSVGRDIARILGANTRHDGYMEGNGYIVTWTFGHLCSLKEPSDYYPGWKRWSLSALPMIPERFGIKVIAQEHIQKQFRVIETLIGRCDEVINCGDAGQEGELIQRWVMQKAKCDKPVSRLWISSMTDEAIREGFANLRPHKELESLYVAGLCRAIGDWILGINATRLYSMRYGHAGQIVSIGRVQTPTLALVVNRQLEIDNFVPTDRWEVRTLYRDVWFAAQIDPFDSEEKAKALIDTFGKEEFHVTGISQKKGTEAPPRLFDLTSLQVECNSRLGLSADDTLKTIQSLYEKKLATYPRVDTTYLTDDMYPKCKGILNNLKGYEEQLQPLRGSKLRKSKKVFDNSKVTDHHAIIPTGQPLPNNLTQTEMDVFDLIARRFIMAFYPDMRYEQTTVAGRVGKTSFKANGKVITDAGWKAMERDSRSGAKKAEEKPMPQFEKGEHGPHKPEIVKKTSTPPKPFTEGTLLKAMETAGSTVEDEELREALKANGIGRPSTRAAIIEVLYKRGYIVRERKSLRATQAGIDLIALINEELLKSAKLTGIWEGRLRKIESGDYSAEEFIAQQKELIKQITLSVLQDNSSQKL